MVMLQVGEVNALFDEIEMLRKNDWQVNTKGHAIMSAKS